MEVRTKVILFCKFYDFAFLVFSVYILVKQDDFKANPIKNLVLKKSKFVLNYLTARYLNSDHNNLLV